MLVNRRSFLKSAVAAAAAPSLIATTAGAAANDRVRLGFIGCGGRARQIMPMFLSHPNAQVVAISDVVESRMDESARLLSDLPRPQTPDKVVDYRRIIDRNDVDAVVIATTQHWHGLPHIHACQAKKHVFVEKPLSHTVVEGRAMVEAAKKSGIIAMLGTQQRAGQHYQKAVQLIRSGRLGKVGLVECWNYHNTGNRAGHVPDAQPPAGFHWDRWLGPAPLVPFNPARVGYNAWFFEYSGGMLTNWAIHHIDIILWAMDEYSPTGISCTGGKYVVNDMADTPDTIDAAWEFPSWLMRYTYRGFNSFHSLQSRPNNHGICFHGNKATMVLDRMGYDIYDDSKPAEIAEKVRGIPYYDARDPMKSEQDGPWHRQFIDCILQNRQPPVDLEIGHKGTVCCHLANISYLAGRMLKWDGTSEQIASDRDASKLLSRPRRAGYELPQP